MSELGLRLQDLTPSEFAAQELGRLDSVVRLQGQDRLPGAVASQVFSDVSAVA